MPDITFEIGRPIPNVFRRAHIKRRQVSDGKFESSFTSITPFVKRWGSVHSGVDDLNLNNFRHSGLTLTCRNDTGAFNREDNLNSLWNGFLTRYRTLLRIQAGYTQDDDTELPATTTVGVFVMDGEIPKRATSNDVTIRASSLQSIFDEVLATEVAGLGATQTASDLIAKIRDHTDGSGNTVFREFITSTSWNISATTNNYNLNTSTTLDGLSCWELMRKLAEAESYVLYIDREGGVNFQSRTVNTGTSIFQFYGQGFNRQNIIQLNESKEALDKYYNFFRLKYLEADTSTSFVDAGTTTTIDPDNISWKYGQRIYEFENTFINNTTTAQTIVNNMFTEFNTVKEEMTIKAKMCPQLEVLDAIDVSYHSYDLSDQPLWDHENWDEFNWAREGENFDLNNKEFKVLSRRLNLDDFSQTFKLREI